MDGQIQIYDRVAAGIHWITALMVVALILFAFGGDLIEEKLDEDFPTMALHKSLGLSVFALTVFRLFWRLTHKVPPLPASTPAWQRASAHSVHIALYGFLLGLPILGYVFGSGGPYPMQWFWIDIPKMPIGKTVAGIAQEAHVIGGYLITALLVMHIGAALWHQFVQRDRLIARMRLGYTGA